MANWQMSPRGNVEKHHCLKQFVKLYQLSIHEPSRNWTSELLIQIPGSCFQSLDGHVVIFVTDYHVSMLRLND